MSIKPKVILKKSFWHIFIKVNKKKNYQPHFSGKMDKYFNYRRRGR